MLELNSLSIKNFMSIGNVTQSINFSKDDLVLVLGENLDLGGNDNRNGVGKSSIVNALSYALYGTALTNIKKDNLINKTNMKNMLVELKFNINGTGYTIKRGRRPNIFKFVEDGKDLPDDDDKVKDTDESQGEGRNTQEEIVRTIGITHDMFRHVLALNTYVEPFLALGTGPQRVIIEQLLGITKLSEKAEKLKEENKVTKDEIKEEEFRITATTAANKRIEVNISGLEAKNVAWDKDREKKINELQESILEFMSVDIDKEIELHKSKKEVEDLTAEYRSLARELSTLDKDVADSTKALARLDKILSTSVEKICPTCSQDMDKDTHEQVHNEYLTRQKDEQAKLTDKKAKREEVSTLATSVKSIIPDLQETFYETIDEAYNHKTTLTTLGNSLENELATINPYLDQIESLKKDGIQVIDYTKMDALVSLRDHQDFLLKLLVSKDSFIRKKIIDQNLAYLNHRLSHYLTNIGLPHSVKFKSDLEVEITMYGKEFDFDNLSRGERTRLILSLSWAFRDVFESMNDKINLLFIDELLDNGTDSAGVEAALAILKKMARDHKRNIYLISHRDELVGRITNVLRVVKENGFTSIENADETEE
jgi:DNA repair exonuclease SbcCD ATPase subunit